MDKFVEVYDKNLKKINHVVLKNGVLPPSRMANEVVIKRPKKRPLVFRYQMVNEILNKETGEISYEIIQKPNINLENFKETLKNETSQSFLFCLNDLNKELFCYQVHKKKHPENQSLENWYQNHISPAFDLIYSEKKRADDLIEGAENLSAFDNFEDFNEDAVSSKIKKTKIAFDEIKNEFNFLR